MTVHLVDSKTLEEILHAIHQLQLTFVKHGFEPPVIHLPDVEVFDRTNVLQ